MSDAELSRLIRTLLDRNESPIERAVVARRLSEQDTQTALNALLQVVQQDGEDVVAFAAGESIAEMLLRRGTVLEAPLALFNAAAYLGFDETVARCQRFQRA